MVNCKDIISFIFDFVKSFFNFLFFVLEDKVMSDCFYFERGPLIYTVDPIHQEKYQVIDTMMVEERVVNSPARKR